MITPVCFQIFIHTLINQHSLSLFNAFNISSQISSLPAALPDFNPHMAAATSVNVKASSLPK